eukprot:gene1919-2354_t
MDQQQSTMTTSMKDDFFMMQQAANRGGINSNSGNTNVSPGYPNSNSTSLPSTSKWGGILPQQPIQQQQQQQQPFSNSNNNGNFNYQKNNHLYQQQPHQQLRRSGEYNSNNWNNNNNSTIHHHQQQNGGGGKMGTPMKSSIDNTSLLTTSPTNNNSSNNGGSSKTKYSKDELLNLYDPAVKIPDTLTTHSHILSEEIQTPINLYFENSNLNKSRDRTRMMGGGNPNMMNSRGGMMKSKDGLSHNSKPKWANSSSSSLHSWRVSKDDERKNLPIWFYLDPQGTTQGPFSNADMDNWNKAGYFNPNLQIKRGENGTFFEFRRLLSLMNSDTPFSSVVSQNDIKSLEKSSEHEGSSEDDLDESVGHDDNDHLPDFEKGGESILKRIEKDLLMKPQSLESVDSKHQVELEQFVAEKKNEWLEKNLPRLEKLANFLWNHGREKPEFFEKKEADFLKARQAKSAAFSGMIVERKEDSFKRVKNLFYDFWEKEWNLMLVQQPNEPPQQPPQQSQSSSSSVSTSSSSLPSSELASLSIESTPPQQQQPQPQPPQQPQQPQFPSNNDQSAANHPSSNQYWNSSFDINAFSNFPQQQQQQQQQPIQQNLSAGFQKGPESVDSYQKYYFYQLHQSLQQQIIQNMQQGQEIQQQIQHLRQQPQSTQVQLQLQHYQQIQQQQMNMGFMLQQKYLQVQMQLQMLQNQFPYQQIPHQQQQQFAFSQQLQQQQQQQQLRQLQLQQQQQLQQQTNPRSPSEQQPISVPIDEIYNQQLQSQQPNLVEQQPIPEVQQQQPESSIQPEQELEQTPVEQVPVQQPHLQKPEDLIVEAQQQIQQQPQQQQPSSRGKKSETSTTKLTLQTDVLSEAKATFNEQPTVTAAEEEISVSVDEQQQQTITPPWATTAVTVGQTRAKGFLEIQQEELMEQKKKEIEDLKQKAVEMKNQQQNTANALKWGGVSAPTAGWSVGNDGRVPSFKELQEEDNKAKSENRRDTGADSYKKPISLTDVMKEQTKEKEKKQQQDLATQQQQQTLKPIFNPSSPWSVEERKPYPSSPSIPDKQTKSTLSVRTQQQPTDETSFWDTSLSTNSKTSRNGNAETLNIIPNKPATIVKSNNNYNSNAILNITPSSSHSGSSKKSTSSPAPSNQPRPDFIKWCHQQLKALNTNMDVATLTELLCSLKTEVEIREYAKECLGFSSDVNSFINEYLLARSDEPGLAFESSSPVITIPIKKSNKPQPPSNNNNNKSKKKK